MIDFSKDIERYLNKTGKGVRLVKANGSEEEFFAVIEQTWKKNHTKFYSHSALPGRYANDFYYYIGPAKADIKALGRDDTFHIDGEQFRIQKAESVAIGSKVQFYRGILRMIREEDENVFSVQD